MTETPRAPAHPIDPLFTRRWSPRALDGAPIAEAELLTLLEAARWAPSAYNAQPWRFLYARRDTPAWGPMFSALVPFNQTWAQNAAALVVVLSRTISGPAGPDAQTNRWHAFDAGAAWASLAFQAELSGLAAHAMAGFDAEALRAALAVPATYDLHAVVAIGRRGDPAQLPDPLRAREAPNGRNPLSAIAAEGAFRFEE
ncbi:MAG: nitroreductase family protein [Alphaproteobacteria bacterium]|nr:nitroreductase family protein [Alphaproteobacteria bacterium]